MATLTTPLLQDGNQVIYSQPMEAGPVILPNSSSCCSCGNRRISARLAVNIAGIAFDVTVIALTYFKLPNVWGAVGAAGGSLLVHGLSTLALYVWKPQNTPNQRVDIERPALPAAQESKEPCAAQLQLADEQRQKLLALEASANKMQKEALEYQEKIASLTAALQDMPKMVDEARAVSKTWQQVMESISAFMAELNPERLPERVPDMPFASCELENPSSLFTQPHAVGEFTRTVTAKLQTLMETIREKQKLLSQSREEVSRLTRENVELGASFKKLQTKYDEIAELQKETGLKLDRALHALQKSKERGESQGSAVKKK